MAKRTYAVVPQRLEVGRGYVPCASHQACRFLVVETTVIPPRKGRHRASINKTVAKFSGPGAQLTAEQLCADLTRRAQPKRLSAKKLRPEPLYRSMTGDEHRQWKGR